MIKSKFLATLAAIGLATASFVGVAAPAAATEGDTTDVAVTTESTETTTEDVVATESTDTTTDSTTDGLETPPAVEGSLSVLVAVIAPATYSICHATEVVGAKNGWLALPPLPVNAIQGGHGNHSGDIIPVIIPEYPNGQNLTTVYTNYDPDLTGAQILAAGCAESPDPVDVCDNLEGDQAEVPEGYYEDDGSCFEIEDYCPNIEGVQSEVPEGFFINGEGDCVELTTLGPVTPVASFQPITCDADGSYTLGTTLPGDSNKITWTVNGVENYPSSTYYVATGMQVTVVAVAVPPDTLEFDWVNPDPYVFTDPTGCDLTTLALTGSSAPYGTLLGAAGVLALGAAMMLFRRREESLFE